MRRVLRILVVWPLVLFALTFLVPVAAASAWWAVQDRPSSWRAADWDSSGLLPSAQAHRSAGIYVLSARTGGAKGAVSVHSWVAYKREGAGRWTRAEVVGWGRPVRIDAYAPDARWYSNEPWVVGALTGAEAEALIPRLDAAIRSYPWSGPRDYVIWPGPNSNSFVAHLLRAVPEIGVVLPPHAAGRDWTGPGLSLRRDRGGDMHVSWSGLIGLSAGPRAGLEVHAFGQAFGLDLTRPALKLPGIGRVGLAEREGAGLLTPPAPSTPPAPTGRAEG